MAQTALRRPVESGVPDNKQFLHPKFIKNYGNWKYHDRPRPGVLHHVSHTGDEVWSVRAGTQRQMDVFTIRKLVILPINSQRALFALPSAQTSSLWYRPLPRLLR